MKLFFYSLVISILLYSCNTGYSNGTETKEIASDPIIELQKTKTYSPISNRETIVSQLKQKAANHDPFVIHVFVPLCDNINQGIVPTTAKMGNGMDLTNNLYWGVRHGMRTIFKLNKSWKTITTKNPSDPNILERVVYRKTQGNKEVYLVMDAYRGDKMKECLEDYFNSLAENKADSISINEKKIGIYGHSDLLVFNGHNGLMDTQISYSVTKDSIREKDAVAIACGSMHYFLEEFKNTNSYPLVTTTNNLYPGGFILEGILEKWMRFESDELIRQEAGNRYHAVKKCGIKGARNLFWTGWK